MNHLRKYRHERCSVEQLESRHLLSADLNGNGIVDFPDFLILSAAFGQNVEPALSGADLDGDGLVAFEDFLILAESFGQPVDPTIEFQAVHSIESTTSETFHAVVNNRTQWDGLLERIAPNSPVDGPPVDLDASTLIFINLGEFSLAFSVSVEKGHA